MTTFESGLYEQIINKLISNRLALLDTEIFHIEHTPIDRQEAARYLSQYLADIIKFALNEIKGDDQLTKQIALSNNIVQLLVRELPHLDLNNNVIDNEGRILEAIFSNIDSSHPNLSDRVKEIMPYTRLSQSELFTGNNTGISLESEIKKEILSADEICWLVSFIKFSGIRVFKDELREFTNSGKKLRIITTSYMGATDLKAIEFLAGLPNTEIKISYNADHERLHAKAYLFRRNSGYHTGYIGSSNLSRSALTNGLEWNLKVTTKEISHIIDKFQKTFDTYWEDSDFEIYQLGKDQHRLSEALKQQRRSGQVLHTTFFDLKPFPYQQEILEKLQSERLVHQRYKNLVVAATGTGKTVISAFDYKRFKEEHPRARLLFVAHRKEILQQARNTFQHVLKDANFGELLVDGESPASYEYLFASIQSLYNQLGGMSRIAEYYDVIIIDEVHHIAASSYRPVLKHFQPQVLLGLTATPERTDGDDILKDFCGVIAAEIRLPEALNRKLLTPFQYFAISDQVDLTKVNWKNGRYEINELSRLYTENDRRVADIIANCDRYLTDIQDVRALGFCVSIEHARYMAEKFVLAGLKADYLTSENAANRDLLREKLRSKEINYLFVRDIFNEGIDIPEIDTVLFLRPTESLTIFLQQLGRGLRLAKDKELLTVLDFVGNAREEYDFEQKFRALIGKTHTPIGKEITDDFPHLPLGCSIILEKKAKEVILNNIKSATRFARRQLIIKIQNFQHQTSLALTLKNFLHFNQMEPALLYRRGSWSRLCTEAGIIDTLDEPNEKELTTAIKKLLRTNSLTYLTFIRQILKREKPVDTLNAEEKTMALMFHYDLWQKSVPEAGFQSLHQSFEQLQKNPTLRAELCDITEYLIEKIDFLEKKIELGFPSPLRLHARYNRSQILAATGLHRYDKASSNREGLALNKELNLESLMVTLKKSEKDYSPTTLYDDYAISEHLFHWQSQNSTTPESAKGQSYINHRDIGKQVLLFVREQNEDAYGNTMSYVCLGKVNFQHYSGSQPMNIEWCLQEAMPAYLWKESGKLAVG